MSKVGFLKKQGGEERVYFTITLRLHSITEGSQSRDTAEGGILLTVPFPRLAQPAFFCSLEHLPRDGAAHSGWALLYLSLILKKDWYRPTTGQS